MRIRSLFPAALAAAALAALVPLATTAAPAAPPTADALLARSATALQKATSMHVELEAHTTAKGDGTLTPAQLKKAAQAVDISARGDLSPTVMSIAGKMGGGGQSLAAELRANGKELYINFLGTWYGTRNSTSKGDSGLTMTTSPKELSGTLGDLMRNGIEATVADGPEVDGVATWKVSGSFDGKQLQKALKATGAASTVNPRDVDRLAGTTDVTVLIGKADELPRRIDIVSTLSGADLTSAKSTTQGLVPLPAAGTKGLKSMTVTMAVALSKFGEKVAFARPAAFKPLESMFEALLGGALGGGSGATKTA